MGLAMERISKHQLAAMIILFQIGSSPLFLLAGEAKRDAWIAIIIAMVCGLMLLAFVTLPIQRQEPNHNLIEILHMYFGKVLGTGIAAVYVIYFIYSSIRNVREFGDLMGSYLLPETPLSMIMLMLMLVSSYAVFKGVEVFFRVAEFLLPLIAMIYILLFSLILMVGLIHFDRLLPVLEEGIRPVIAAALPEVVSFPFGEMVLFLMYWKYLNDKRELPKITLTFYCSAGVFLVVTNMIIVASLGPLADVGGIPLMLSTSMIQISIIERMDPFVALLLFLGVLIKQAAYYLAASLALANIFQVPHRYMIIPAGAAIYFGSFLFRSLMQQIWFGFEYNIKYHFPIFQIVIPLVVLAVMKIRGKQLARKT